MGSQQNSNNLHAYNKSFNLRYLFFIIHTIHETDVGFYLYKYYLVLQTNM